MKQVFMVAVNSSAPTLPCRAKPSESLVNPEMSRMRPCSPLPETIPGGGHDPIDHKAWEVRGEVIPSVGGLDVTDSSAGSS